ncbi:hypothetical protein GQ53DRAFT_756485 [Thozetella sp. PMI_491]|nr:hypothetical protein GQ53DRAFT_756485 [Thozetella sp. PMI_491]
MADIGLKKVYDAENAKVDIVFLHGLRGNMVDTWSKDGVLWPQELLPKDTPESRIFLFGYDSGITHRDQSAVTNTEIHSDANDLVARLSAERSSTKTEDRPIIIVSHSLGGLVAAQALIHGERQSEGAASSITKNLRGMLFLGTPFRGSGAAKPAEMVRRVLEVFRVDTQKSTLKLLGVDSERLDELTRAFPEVLNKRRTSAKPGDKIEAFFFYETRKTGLIQVVEPDSAQLPGCGDAAPIHANHIGICKFGTEKDEGYSLVVAAIRKVMLPANAAPQEGVSKTINVLGKAVYVSNEDINIYGNSTINL